MTRAELLEVVYRFYPRGLLVDNDGYDDTEEAHRQREVVPRAVAGCPTWEAMLHRLGARYPVTNHSPYILAAEYRGYDSAYSADAVIPGHRLGFHVSLLGPYYGIRRLGAPGEEPAARDLAEEIEATFPGYAPIPPELGDEIVPDVSLDKRILGKATIYDCVPRAGVGEELRAVAAAAASPARAGPPALRCAAGL